MLLKKTILTFQSALDERIPVVPLVAFADGIVIGDSAFGIHSAGAGAWVSAARVHASLLVGLPNYFFEKKFFFFIIYDFLY